LSESPLLWDKPEKAQKTMRERTHLANAIEAYRAMERELDDALTLAELGEAEGDEKTVDEAQAQLAALQTEAAKRELESLLSGEADQNDCYLEVHAGAGGTEAQDWAEMLLRMYTRWAEQHGYKVEWLEESPGEEAGIKSATIEVKGPNAYGWLKSESGVHRLVRISPYDSNARRHTSFASAWVYPVVDDAIEIEILDKDLKVDTFRASGAGGQHINKTDSAIRITHLPTGMVVECQDERSQHKNRARALSLLAAKLQSMEEDKRHAEESATRRSLVGSGDRSERIRTYNFPQGRLTDHRINLTLYKLEDVLGGNLDPVIQPLVHEYQADQLAALGS
jgi:peptide chain release factor 2